MIVLAIVVVGATSYFQLALDKHPQVELPTVAVRTQLPGASPDEVESSVSQVIEEAVNTIEGIQELRSGSGNGTSNVIITFNLNRDIETAAQDVRDRVGAILRNLPPDILPPIVQKFDSDQSPSLSISLASNRPIRELTEIADKVVKEQIERSPGVGAVGINGGMARMRTVHPLDFARIKRQLSKDRQRDPRKKAKDLAQANMVEALVREYLPHLVSASAPA